VLEIKVDAIVNNKIGFFIMVELNCIYFRFDFTGVLDLTGASFLLDSILGAELGFDSVRAGRSLDGDGIGFASLCGLSYDGELEAGREERSFHVGVSLGFTFTSSLFEADDSRSGAVGWSRLYEGVNDI